ncbi:hypothetical protein DFO50_109111 [Microvirgula sp. AG722]|nr:hypothetical protein DFO50_109111 [Microvirgula sp. AG722]
MRASFTQRQLQDYIRRARERRASDAGGPARGNEYDRRRADARRFREGLDELIGAVFGPKHH